MELQHVERRMAAILAADVAGYSRLMGVDEEGTHARLKAHRRELIDPKIKEHHGRIVKSTGDGVLVEFPSVVEAVRCAIEVQHGMAERDANTPRHQRIEFRVGINLGDVILEEDDIYGDGVNIAARLENLARPGSICISGTAFDQVENKIPLDCKFLGKQRVKNIAQPVRVYRIRLERRRIATTLRSWRTKLVAGAALLIVIGVAGAAYLQHRASVTQSASMPSGSQNEVQAVTSPPETLKDMPPLDAQVWEAIRNSTNPEDYEAYLRIFPTGAVADLARVRLKALTPVPPPPVSTTEPIPAAPKPKPQQKAMATKTVPSPVPAHEPPASTNALTSTTQTPAPQQEANAVAPISPPAPVTAPQHQALAGPELSKSVPSPPSVSAPYDGEWKGFVLGGPNCPSGSCQGDIKATVAKNAVSGKMESKIGNQILSGTIASDGSFTGSVGDGTIFGKFDKDGFKGMIRHAGPVNSSGFGSAVVLERVK